jgi:hypothetical protein
MTSTPPTVPAPAPVDEWGSFISKGPRFSVLDCRGPVQHRQTLASKNGVICFAEQHLNWAPRPSTNHAFVITGDPTPPRTELWAAEYLSRVSLATGASSLGIRKGVQGSGNVRWVKWPTPSMLLEPLFLTNPEMAEWLQHPHAREIMGNCLADSVEATFARGLVGLSTGHAFRKRGVGVSSGDPGALYPDPPASAEEPSTYWDANFDTEAEICADIIQWATLRLVGMPLANAGTN